MAHDSSTLTQLITSSSYEKKFVFIAKTAVLQASAGLGWLQKTETKVLAAICNKSRRRQPSKRTSLAR